MIDLSKLESVLNYADNHQVKNKSSVFVYFD